MQLWSLLENRQNNQDQRFRAVAVFDPDDPRWEKMALRVFEWVVFGLLSR
jgi:hypothetical protein